MGLSFHYSGKLAKPEYLPQLIDEVTQVCKVYKWKYHTLNPAFPEGTDFSKDDFTDEIYGITFTPPGCETVDISFLSNGKMSSPMLFLFYGEDKQSIEKGFLFMLSVKTQFSSPAIHLVIMNLFRHLSEKYLTDFKLNDEAQYWETNDEKIMNQNFAKYNALIEDFTLGIASISLEKDEELLDYIIRIADRVNRLKE